MTGFLIFEFLVVFLYAVIGINYVFNRMFEHFKNKFKEKKEKRQ